MTSDAQLPGPPAVEESVPVGVAGTTGPAAAARGSADTEFAAFVTAHQGELLRTAWLLVGDPHRAEELTQQALVRTYVAWPRARQAPVPYARRVLVNLRTDTWRRRRRDVLVAEVPDDATPSGSRSTPVVADVHADRDELVRALAVLTARQRRVVVLRHLVGLSEAEVAEELGIGVGTVKSTASRALARLREQMTTDRAAAADPNTARRTPGSPR